MSIPIRQERVPETPHGDCRLECVYAGLDEHGLRLGHPTIDVVAGHLETRHWEFQPGSRIPYRLGRAQQYLRTVGRPRLDDLPGPNRFGFAQREARR